MAGIQNKLKRIQVIGAKPKGKVVGHQQYAAMGEEGHQTSSIANSSSKRSYFSFKI
jgi:hypothetical protein